MISLFNTLHMQLEFERATMVGSLLDTRHYVGAGAYIRFRSRKLHEVLSSVNRILLLRTHHGVRKKMNNSLGFGWLNAHAILDLA